MVTRLIAPVALAGLALAGTASAAGGPVDMIAGPGGVTTPQSDVRFVTLHARGGTIVSEIHKRGGQVQLSQFMRGAFEVPAVTPRGAAGGLSADGGTLVLMRPPRFHPARHTTFALLDAGSLRLSRMVTLRGEFAFDAISPSGGALYLIQSLTPGDPGNYAVRAYDVGGGRLRPKPIVDPHERSDEMRGYPISRSYSPDGRWAYTLYDGFGAHPFVHALDTVRGTAKCIDTPSLAGRDDLEELNLTTGTGGGRLSISSKHGPLAIVDTATFRVSSPASRAVASEAGRGGGGAGAWPVLGFAGLVLAGGAAALAIRRRRKLATG